MSQYGVDYLQRLRAAVEKFEGAFNSWMDTQVESDHMSSRGLLPTVWTKDGQDSAMVQRLELNVAEAAGLAASAVSVTGAYIAIAGLGAIDPISNWSFMSSPKAPIAPRDIRTTTANVKGRLDAILMLNRVATLTCRPSRQHSFILLCGRGRLRTGRLISIASLSAKHPKGSPFTGKSGSGGAMWMTRCSGSRRFRQAPPSLESRNSRGLVLLKTRQSRACGAAWNHLPRHSTRLPPG